MIAAPAVDIRGGRCVQLVGGRPEDERVSLPDPVAVARDWWEMGYRTLHVVDLDAALGAPAQTALVEALVQATAATVQMGGGLRDDEAVRRVLEVGADRAVVGTRAVDDPEWLARLAERHPGRIMVAADIRDGRVLRKGWTEATGLDVIDFVEGLAQLPLAGILCTDVAREGRVQGIDLPGARAVIEASPHPVWISGGVSSDKDLRNLNEAGARGVVLGMALYTGALDARAVAREYGA
jgi:phosphoribosylformimino-5-aminoimidazole carboxamide ribotide isomerase